MGTRTHQSLVGASLLACGLAALSPADAVAQPPTRDHTMRPRLALRGAMGFAGEVRFAFDEEAPAGEDDFVDDLDTTWGGAAEIEVPLVSFLSIGGEVGAHAWSSGGVRGASPDRSVLVDVAAVPRLRVPFEGTEAHGALAVGVPIGLALNVLDDGYQSAARSIGGDVSTGVGAMLGVRLGGQLFLSPDVGLTVEVGYIARVVRHRFRGPLGAQDTFRLTFHQMTAQAGVIFGL